MSREEISTSSDEGQGPIRPKQKGGIINRFEPLDTFQITSSPIILSCFQDVGCYHFCERVKQVQNHSDLTRLFILSLQDKQVNLAGVNFELSSESIARATGIPDVGERWFKKKKLALSYYEPFLKPRYHQGCNKFFPFSHLLQRYAPLMRQIINYFTCGGRYSRLYSYHIRLLMHFTRIKLLNLPYYL